MAVLNFAGLMPATPASNTKILKGATIIEGRPGASMPPYDWAGAKKEMETLAGVEVARRDVISYALYPKVMREYMEHRALPGDTSVLPTPTFFYGLRVGEEAWIDIEPGKTLIVKLLSVGDIEPDGARVRIDDPARAAAEYGAEFRRDIESFLAREAINAVVVSGRRELPRLPSLHYVFFLDFAGGSGGDSATLCGAHVEERNGRRIAVVDIIREVRPPFSPEETCALSASASR